jgi:acetyl-CoA synthetase
MWEITSADLREQAYQNSLDNPEAFWANIAEQFTWQKPWNKVLKYSFDPYHLTWFEGAKLNMTENCLDRHLPQHKDKVAIIFEPNNPKEKTKKITYEKLLHEVCTWANMLAQEGVKKGDRVCIYMPMIPEAVYTMLACARIGAIHSVIFGGFAAQSIQDRLLDAACTFVITADGAYRGDKFIPLKENIDHALQVKTAVQKVIVCKHSHSEVFMQKDRDFYAEPLLEKYRTDFIPASSMDAEDALFILYTSGSTGKPKGVVHSTAGYMVYTAYSFKNVFQYQDGDVYFCTADIGWITGHSYNVYAPLLLGATLVLFEGTPTYPNPSRWWDILEKHKVNIFYTAPTAIRSLMAFGDEPLKGKDLSSLKVLGCVGEPLNQEAWHWYFEKIGASKCPIVDTWWQTETGGILISAMANITPCIPTYATKPLPGVQMVLVDEHGEVLPENPASGYLCLAFPVPSLLRTTYNDHARCEQSYFKTYPNLYFTGDGAQRDEAGNYRITGRVDDVLNVSGHRIGTAELEDAINLHPKVLESAVVGFAHPIKGEGIYAFVISNEDIKTLGAEIHALVQKQIGAIAKPDKIQVVKGLPRTRSGKIMRRILRKLAQGETDNLGDTSTLVDASVIDTIKEGLLI